MNELKDWVTQHWAYWIAVIAVAEVAEVLCLLFG